MHIASIPSSASRRPFFNEVLPYCLHTSFSFKDEAVYQLRIDQISLPIPFHSEIFKRCNSLYMIGQKLDHNLVFETLLNQSPHEYTVIYFGGSDVELSAAPTPLTLVALCSPFASSLKLPRQYPHTFRHVSKLLVCRPTVYPQSTHLY